MEQGVQYLYEIENGKRTRNVGFLRSETQSGKCTLVIHARQLDEVVGIQFRRETGEVYLAKWEDMKPDLEIAAEEYVVPVNTKYEKISRQDLSCLPRKEWRLANNSFLLHGYYNYHHLLSIEEDGKRWLGVPGQMRWRNI